MDPQVKVENGKIFRSTDTLIWTEVVKPEGPTISHAFPINEQWIAVRSDGSVIMSHDSIVWTVAAPI